MFEFASGPNLLRLLAVPAFAYAAWSDYQTRRVDSRIWGVLIIIGTVAAVWELSQLAPIHTVREYDIFMRVLLVPPVVGAAAVFLNATGALGGADAKAIFAISILFPATVQYNLPFTQSHLPLYESELMIFAITIVVNAFIFAFAFPMYMWYQNYKNGYKTKDALISYYIPTSKINQTPGMITSDNPDFKLDTDALRMYLRWRNVDIESIRTHKETLEKPETVTTTYQIEDGAITPSSNHKLTEIGELLPKPSEEKKSNRTVDPDEDDRWAANEFLNTINHHAYNTSPEQLRKGLDHIAESETIRVSPAFPFIIPLFVGLILSLTVGDIARLWAVLVL